MLLIDRRRYMHASNDVIMTSATNPEVLAICYAQGWCASADKMTKSEAEQVTDIAQVFRASNIVHFDEFQYFTSVTALQDRAIYNCSALTSIVLPSSLTSIGQYAFYNSHLMELTALPSGLTSMDIGSFMLCKKLALTSLPSGLTAIPDHCFGGCTALALTSLPSGLADIGVGAFQSCNNISINEWSNALVTIGDSAFRDNTSLTFVELASTCTEISTNAFRNTRNVGTITCHATTAPTIYDYTFYYCGGTASNKVLRVPSGASGYNSGYWQDLQDTNGFTLQYI